MFLRILLVCSPVLIGLAAVAHAAPAGSPMPQAVAQAAARARQAGVADADVQAVLRLSAQHGYTATDTAGFVQQLGQVKGRQLPEEAVRDKILEGIAKQQPAATINQVAGRWAQALGQAQLRVNRMQGTLPPMNAGERATLVKMAALDLHQHGQAHLLDNLEKQLATRKTADARTVLRSVQVAQVFMLHGASPQQAAQVQQLGLASPGGQQQQTLHQQALAQLRAGKPAAAVIANLHPAGHGTAPVTPGAASVGKGLERVAHTRTPRASRPAWHGRITRPARTVRITRPERVHRIARIERPHRPGHIQRPVRPDVAVGLHGMAHPARIERPERINRPDKVDRPEKVERPERIERPLAIDRLQR